MKTRHWIQTSPRLSRISTPVESRPRLLFGPVAWLKWQYLCHAGPTEVGGFGLSTAADPLYLEDVLVVRQRATPLTVAFDDAAVADLFDAMADAAIPPARFARVWLHTHPGVSVVPSGTDEDTFARAFGGCDWAVMAILGRGGRTSARLRFSVGPGASIELPTAVDWAAWPAAAPDTGRPFADLIAGWREQYEALVEQAPAIDGPTLLDPSLAQLLERPGNSPVDQFIDSLFWRTP